VQIRHITTCACISSNSATIEQMYTRFKTQQTVQIGCSWKRY